MQYKKQGANGLKRANKATEIKGFWLAIGINQPESNSEYGSHETNIRFMNMLSINSVRALRLRVCIFLQFKGHVDEQDRAKPQST